MAAVISSTLPKSSIARATELRHLELIIPTLAISILGILGLTGVLPNCSVSLGGCFMAWTAPLILMHIFTSLETLKAKKALEFDSNSMQKLKPEAEVPVKIDLKLVKERNFYQMGTAQSYLLLTIGILVTGILGLSGVVFMQNSMIGVCLGMGGFSVAVALHQVWRAYQAQKRVDLHIRQVQQEGRQFPRYKL